MRRRAILDAVMCADRGAGFANAAPATLPPLVLDGPRLPSRGSHGVQGLHADPRGALPFSKLHRPPRMPQQHTAAAPAPLALKENFAVGVRQAGPNASTGGCGAEAKRAAPPLAELPATAVASRALTATANAGCGQDAPEHALRACALRSNLASACGGHGLRSHAPSRHARARTGRGTPFLTEEAYCARPVAGTKASAWSVLDQEDALLRLASSMETLHFGAHTPDLELNSVAPASSVLNAPRLAVPGDGIRLGAAQMARNAGSATASCAVTPVEAGAVAQASPSEAAQHDATVVQVALQADGTLSESDFARVRGTHAAG